MSHNNVTHFESVNRLNLELKETLGIIESVTVQNTQLYAVLRRSSLEDEYGEMESHGYRLYNDILGLENKNLSIYELAIPLLGIDLNLAVIDYKSLLGKYARVYEKNNKALYSQYIGELSALNDSLTYISRDEIFKARILLREENKDNTPENLRNKLVSLGYDSYTIEKLFEVNVEDALDKVVLWEGDAYYNKDIATPDVNEIIVEPHPNQKYLNILGMKVKACHKFNKLFSAK